MSPVDIVACADLEAVFIEAVQVRHDRGLVRHGNHAASEGVLSENVQDFFDRATFLGKEAPVIA